MNATSFPKPVTPGEAMLSEPESHSEKLLNGIFTREVPAIEVPEFIRKKTVIGRFAHDIAAQTEMPFASVFVTLLGVASIPADCSFVTRFPGGDELPPGLFTVCEQPPASGKSWVLKYGLHAYSSEIYRLNAEIHKQNEVAKEDKTIRKRPYVISSITDGTTAAIDNALSQSKNGRLPLASSEQGLFMSLFPGENGYSSNNDLLLSGWDGGWVSGARVSRQAYVGKVNAQVVMFAQNGSIQRVLRASNGSGLTERFLFVAEQSNLGRRKFESHTVDTGQYDKAAARCVKRMGDELPKIVIEPCREGRAFIRHQKIAHEPTLGELHRAGEAVMVGWLGKLENHILKIAATLHSFEVMQSDNVEFPFPVQIPLETVEAACELVVSLMAHMRAILDATGESGMQTAIDSILTLIRDSKKPLPVSDVARKIRDRKPFSAMGNDSYASAKKFIEMLIIKGILVKVAGKLEPG